MEILFVGGTIITVDSDNRFPEAVAVRNGKIIGVGSLGETQSLLSDGHQTVDLKGKYLLPGLIDAHSHPLWAAKTRGAPVVDVRAETVPTYQAVLSKIKRRVAVAEPNEHLIFFGLDAQLHPDMESPTRALLDEIAPHNPIGIQTSNCHALYMNSKGFEVCGIDENTPTPTGSIIERDSAGRPSGKIAEAITWSALETFYTAWGDQRLNDQFKASICEFIQNGITTVTEHLYMPFYKAYYQSALNQGLSLPRVAAYQQATTADMQVENLSMGDDRLWMAGVKIHADGSPLIGNIWLSQPYLETETTLERMNLKPGHTGSVNYPQEFFEKMVRTYFAQGWQMTIHTQGDRTIDMVLDLVETILSETPRDDHRFRLEHCALMREDQIIRAQELGVLCSFFINHITHWGAPIEDALFGPERAAHYMPAGTAVKYGMKISLHADTPMTDPSGLELMQAAITRKAGDGRCLGQDECLDVMTALKSVTIDAAYQIGMEDKLGSITSGKHADFVILDQDVFQCDPNELSKINIHATYLAGELVWHNGL
ncbi:amidohydrolase [Amylibacter sp. SFDW26]|uniref:amidohydrolase n=1 Tax=Amylibacter sp. SFDW26 TaxID=2652722 RepID=UPI0012613B57|nr:amidohydrolase [Amylibacter sp. SFDW26]KAB7614399.1 amidohydrolase [Amylibacter sp. SFDW26]